MSLSIGIVGLPNVGKSTLFNKLVGKRISIVEDTPGVTRDRIYSKCEWRGKEFMVVDTGGIEPDSDDVILAQMRRQSELAIEKAEEEARIKAEEEARRRAEEEAAAAKAEEAKAAE